MVVYSKPDISVATITVKLHLTLTLENNGRTMMQDGKEKAQIYIR